MAPFARRLARLVPFACALVLAASCGQSEDPLAVLNSVANTDAMALAAGSFTYTARSSYCIDVRSSGTANGTPVQLWGCNNTGAQSWTYTQGTLVAFGNKCLDLPGGNTADGTKLQIWDCTPNNHNQQWTVANGRITFTATNKCVDLPSSNVRSGSQLQLWDCNGTAAQGWTYSGGGGSGPSQDTLSDILPLASDSTASSQTPMGTRFENLLNITPTAAQLSFLQDPKQQPPIPGSASGLHLQTFNVTLYPSGNPAPTDINQHAIGDCDGDSAFASMAYVAPSFVKNLITNKGNGVFSVAAYDPHGKPITIVVDSTFLADDSNNIGAVSGKNGVATWATVLEKVVMKYIAVWPVVSDVGGIGSEDTTPIFTGDGSSFAFDRGVLSPSQLTRAANALLQDGKFITGGFGQVMTVGQDESVTGHGYAVLVPAPGAMISMRNPWGVNPTTSGNYDGSNDGVLNIPSTTAWAGTIDLRVIDPGAAASLAGTTTVYTPSAEAVATHDIRVTEPHSHRGRQLY